jgi:hypothetical protein
MLDDFVFVVTTANERIGDEGIIRIAEGLEKNTSLTKLDIRGAILPFIVHLLPHLSCMLESLQSNF